jgi:hypothetical protein
MSLQCRKPALRLLVISLLAFDYSVCCIQNIGRAFPWYETAHGDLDGEVLRKCVRTLDISTASQPFCCALLLPPNNQCLPGRRTPIPIKGDGCSFVLREDKQNKEGSEIMEVPTLLPLVTSLRSKVWLLQGIATTII